MKTSATPRPISVTIIGWLLVVSGVLGLVLYFILFDLHEAITKLPLLLAISFFVNLATTLVLAICGTAILKGRNWGRQLWIGGTIADYTAVGVAGGMRLNWFLGIAFCMGITFFLYRPKASQYFAHQLPSTPVSPA